jgi:hypothetical protein
MTTLPRHPSRRYRSRGDDAPSRSVARPLAASYVLPPRADCCVAPAAYRVLLSIAADHHAAVELLLCGHHYRTSRTALARCGATAYDLHGRLA